MPSALKHLDMDPGIGRSSVCPGTSAIVGFACLARLGDELSFARQTACASALFRSQLEPPILAGPSST